MVTVGDQELAIGEPPRSAPRRAARVWCLRPRGPAPARGPSNGARLRGGGRSARAGRLSRRIRSRSSRPTVRALVGQHGSRLVRLDLERPDHAVCSRDPVGPDVVLDSAQNRPLVRDQDLCREPSLGTAGRPRPPTRGASDGRRCRGSSFRAPRAPRASMTSYGGATRSSSGPAALVVPQRSKRLDLGQSGHPTIRFCIDLLRVRDCRAGAGPGRRGRLRGREEGAPAHEGRRAVPGPRAGRPERSHRGPGLERRGAARPALR